MPEKSRGATIRDIMPDLLLNIDDIQDAKAGSGLKELLRDTKDYLVQGEQGVSDIQKFFFAVVKQASLDSGVPVKDAFEIDESDLEVLYALAHNLYSCGKYREATNMFRLLIMLDHFEFKYLFGFAACLQMQENYFVAATAYAVAATASPKNPLPHFHAAECYLKMHDLPSASVALGLAAETADDQEEYLLLKERSIATKEQLLRKISERKGESS